MGAVLIPCANVPDIQLSLEKARQFLRVKALHSTDLDHNKLTYLSIKAAQQRIRAFGVVSKKATLGSYREMISGERRHQDYYNKCSHYLLELVGKALKRYQISVSVAWHPPVFDTDDLGLRPCWITGGEFRHGDYERVSHAFGR